jgi:hypothetical protein
LRREQQQINSEFKEAKPHVTLPGVVVGTPPSASFLGHSRSFCLPVLSCLLLLNRNMVAPPTASGSSPDETSHTYIRNKKKHRKLKCKGNHLVEKYITTMATDNLIIWIY